MFSLFSLQCTCNTCCHSNCKNCGECSATCQNKGNSIKKIEVSKKISKI